MTKIFSVSEFIQSLNELMLGQFVVEGEICELKASQDKWLFFTIKDESSSLSCFASIWKVRVPLENGMRVRLVGYPQIYAKSGRLSLVVEQAELVGEGSLERAYKILKANLAAEGLFSPERKRELPRFPRSIGVIASRDSAAWGDFQRILKNRWSGLNIFLYHSSVQGTSAVEEIMKGFAALQSAGVEVIALIRGGGSLEDLAAFNREEVVRSVFNSRIPVITGVGHERDETLVDFVADVRASTPSNAAEILVPDRRDVLSELEFSLENMAAQLQHQILEEKHKLGRQSQMLINNFSRIGEKIEFSVQKFALQKSVFTSYIDSWQEKVKNAETFLKNMNPHAVLGRGYSIVRDDKNRIITSPGDVDSGEKLMIELAKGKITAQTL